MTREQSKQIRQIEAIVDKLSEYEEGWQRPYNNEVFEPISDILPRGTEASEAFRADVKVFNAKVHDYALGLLNELKDKYLKIYAEL